METSLRRRISFGSSYGFTIPGYLFRSCGSSAANYIGHEAEGTQHFLAVIAFSGKLLMKEY